MKPSVFARGVVCVAVATATTLAALPASVAQTPHGFSDGKWVLLYDAALRSTRSSGAVTARADSYLAGGGSFEVNGGDVTGTFDGNGSTAGTAQTSSASGEGLLALTATGTMGGIATAPTLDGSVRVTGSIHVTVGTFSLDTPIDVSGPMGGDGPATLSIANASCTHVTGDWTVGLRSSAGANGVQVEGPASFDAYRISGPSHLFAYANKVERLYREVSIFEATVTAGHADLARLASLLAQAEDLLADLPAFAACDDEDASAGYVSSVADQLDRVLNALMAHPDQLDTTSIIELLTDAARVGILGGWSADGDATQAKFETELGNRLDTAIASGDTDTIERIDAAAQQFGWTDLADRAGAAL